MPQRKPSMALGPGFHLCERRGLSSFIGSRRQVRPAPSPPAICGFAPKPPEHVGRSSTLDTRIQGATGKTGTELSTLGLERGFRKGGLVLVNSCQKTGDGTSPPTCVKWDRGWMRHMLATILYLLPRVGKD